MRFRELFQQIAEHAARHLVAQRVNVDAEKLRAQKTVCNIFLANLCEVFCNFREFLDVKARVIGRSL